MEINARDRKSDRKRERGASLVEYALLLALIAVVAIGGITLVGQKAEAEFDCVAIELGDPQVGRKVLHKIRNDVPGFTVVEAKFSANCL